MRCLARNQRYRPQSADELAADLRLHDDAATVPLRPTAPTRVMSSPLRHYERIQGRWLGTRYVVFAAVLFVIIAVSAVLASGGDKNRAPAPSPKPVAGVPSGGTPTDQARNLAGWIRQHSSR
jgi:hypothetical protein